MENKVIMQINRFPDDSLRVKYNELSDLEVRALIDYLEEVRETLKYVGVQEFEEHYHL